MEIGRFNAKERLRAAFRITCAHVINKSQCNNELPQCAHFLKPQPAISYICEPLFALPIVSFQFNLNVILLISSLSSTEFSHQNSEFVSYYQKQLTALTNTKSINI